MFHLVIEDRNGYIDDSVFEYGTVADARVVAKYIWENRLNLVSIKIADREGETQYEYTTNES